MIARFEVIADSSVWEVDVENLTWRQVSDEPDAPAGKLSLASYGVYSMAPRRPDTPGMGAGLSTVLITPLPVGQILYLYLRANVETRNFTMPKPITSIRYEILPFNK